MLGKFVIFKVYSETKVLNKKNKEVQVRCLEKPFGIREPQEFEREEDAIYYEKVYKADVNPQMVQKGRKWLWVY